MAIRKMNNYTVVYRNLNTGRLTSIDFRAKNEDYARKRVIEDKILEQYAKPQGSVRECSIHDYIGKIGTLRYIPKMDVYQWIDPILGVTKLVAKPTGKILWSV